jgi:hypothetical protein
MEGKRDSADKPPRKKVVTLRPRVRDDESKPATVPVAEDPRSLWRRRQQLVLWAERGWVLLAIVFAAHRLWSEVTRREVFDAEASMAFALVVTAPLLIGKGVWTIVGSAIRALARKRRQRSVSESPRSDAQTTSGGGPGRQVGPHRKP